MDRLASMQLFVRVAETGSFSKASADLNIAQPTVTKHVAALEQRLGARLLNRNTRGVSLTEIGALYYERCKAIQREMDEADNLAALLQKKVRGKLRVGTSVAFGRRVMTPLLLRFMAAQPEIDIDLSVEDRYVNLIEQGIDVAIRLGRLADSSLGARYLGLNPWVMVASDRYLSRAGEPQRLEDLAHHNCLIYSTVQGDDLWHFTDPRAGPRLVRVSGRLRSNNLSALLEACREHMGLAILPWYVARESVASGAVRPVMTEFALPAQEIHAVYPSPTLVSAKVSTLIAFLQDCFVDRWWLADPGTDLAKE